MARKVNQVLWDQWRQRIGRQRTSGMSVASFCRKEGVSQAAFHGWKRRLRGGTAARRSSRGASPARDSRGRRAATRRRGQPKSVADVAGLTRSADFLQLPIRGMRSSPWIELTLVDGTLVRVPQENLTALAMVLKVLRGDDMDLLSGEVRHA